MPETPIEPALTAEEWAKVEIPPLPRDPRDHALAALCLVDQPWGFTAEDVEACRALAQQERSDYAAFWRSLADRIEALLPPA